MLNLNVRVLVDKLDDINNNRPQDLVAAYQKTFSNPDSEIVLIDLMMRFGEFKPSTDNFQAGNQAVLIYIKNRLLGIVEPPTHKENVNEPTTN